MNRDWKRKDFDSMHIYNPFYPPDQKFSTYIWERNEFPTACVKKHHEYQGSKENRERTIKYLLYMYDKGSPLRKDIPDLAERKLEAARLAGFVVNNTLHSDYKVYPNLFNLTSEVVRTMTLSMLQFQNSREWAMLVTAEQQMWENMRDIFQIQTSKEDSAKDRAEVAKKKSMLIEENRKLDAICKEYEAVIFGDNDDVKTVAATVRGNVTPEKLAHNMFRNPKGD